LYNPVWQPAVYTIQPVVNPVWQPVWQPVGCLFTRYSRLSNQLYNRFDNRLYRVNGVLLSAAATISLVACSCKRKRKRAKRLWMRPLFQRQHKYYVTWFHQTLSLAATLLPRECFPSRLKACNYCLQELQRVACNNCTWNHGIRGKIGLHIGATLRTVHVRRRCGLLPNYFHNLLLLLLQYYNTAACLKPNSITLSGRWQVRSWSQTCSELEFGPSSS